HVKEFWHEAPDATARKALAALSPREGAEQQEEVMPDDSAGAIEDGRSQPDVAAPADRTSVEARSEAVEYIKRDGLVREAHPQAGINKVARGAQSEAAQPFTWAFVDPAVSNELRNIVAGISMGPDARSILLTLADNLEREAKVSHPLVGGTKWRNTSEQMPAEKLPVLVDGGMAMWRDGVWYTGMEEPWFQRPIEWTVRRWAPITAALNRLSADPQEKKDAI
ncbi:hypothetical protein LCGC14_2021280, partial [marine sediment metagenome]